MYFVIMDVTCGDLVGGVFATRKSAQEWIDNQEITEKYEIGERE